MEDKTKEDHGRDERDADESMSRWKKGAARALPTGRLQTHRSSRRPREVTLIWNLFGFQLKDLHHRPPCTFIWYSAAATGINR